MTPTSPTWAGRVRILLHGGVVYSPTHPFSTAIMIEGGSIAWIGEDTAADVHRGDADVVVDLQGAFVAPGFVDAHVHATSTGLQLTGLDLSRANGPAEVMRMLADRLSDSGDGPVIGHGWDETRWPEQATPTRAEIDALAGPRVVYLSRIDVHSALVSGAAVDAAPEARSAHGWSEIGPLTRAAHIRVREASLGMVTREQRRAAQRTMRTAAAGLGIVAMHEMAGPGISSDEDLADLLALVDQEPGPLVEGYWGQLAQQGGIERAMALGAIGVAGDLFIDGAIGSRTACLAHPYSDDPGTTGAAYLDEETVAEHLVAATQSGLQGGFHVIGDGASATVSAALRRAAGQLGPDALRRAGHRLEHVEMLSDDDIAVLAQFGVTASMQPMFDALWAGSGGMYEQRLGTARAGDMNRFASIAAAGGMLAFGSDAPVTELGPWQAIRAAVHHSNPEQRISARAAFAAHTRGGWRAAGHSSAGVLAPGAPAHLAIWREEELEVRAPDDRIAAWSTDARSGTPGLPVLDPDRPLPSCIATLVAGRVVHHDGSLEGLPSS